MERDKLAAVATDIPSLRGIFLTTFPECLLYDAWTVTGEQWETEKAATYFGDLVRSNRAALRALGAWSSDMQITVEAGELLIVLREVSERLVVAMLFGRDTPLGMVRINVGKILDRLAAVLPDADEDTKLSRGARAIEFLGRYAPDPHAVLLRLSLRTGIAHERLSSPQELTESEDETIESAVRDILGLERLEI